MVSESAFLPKSSKYKIYIINPLPTISINQPPKYPYLGKLLSLPGGCFSPSNVGRMTPTSSYGPRKEGFWHHGDHYIPPISWSLQLC